MAEFLDTGLGITVLIAAQSLLVVGFVMISLIFLVYADRKVWAAGPDAARPERGGAMGLAANLCRCDQIRSSREVVIPAGVDRPV